MISIENLRHFVAVVDNQGVIRASEKIFISPSSITRSVQTIETELGKALFDRIGRKVQVNPDGQTFFVTAQRLLADYAALTMGERKERLIQGHYRIGASHFLCEHWLSELALRFSRKYPLASLEVFSLDSGVLLRKLVRGDLDFGVCFSPKLPEAVEERVLHRGQLWLAAGKRHALASMPFAELKKKISDFPAVIHRGIDSVDRCDNHPMFKKYKIAPRFQMYWDSDYFASRVLSGNEHWSMLPDFVLDALPGVVKLSHPTDWKAPYQISAVWNRRKAVDDFREAFFESGPA